MAYQRVCIKCGNGFASGCPTAKRCRDCKVGSCLECGGPFHIASTNSTKRFCSLGCRSKHRFAGVRVSLTCEQCGKAITKAPSGIKGHTFCGRGCRNRFFWTDAGIRGKLIASIKASPSVRSEGRREQLKAALARHGYSQGFRDKVRAKRMEQRFPTKMTSIEKALHDAFRAAGIAFEMHRTMFGRYQPDFVMDGPRLIVQADGDYWHGTEPAKARDRAFNRAARADGWCVIRLREKDIKGNLPACLRRVRKAMHRSTLRINESQLIGATPGTA